MFAVVAGCGGDGRDNALPNGNEDSSNVSGEKPSDSIQNTDSKTKDISVEAGFYTLESAYDIGLITKEDLLSIAYYHHSQAMYPHDGTKFNAELMGENYTPIAKPQDELDDEQINAIKQALVDELKQRFGFESFEIDNIYVTHYCGTYNGCIAFIPVYAEDGYYAANCMVNEHQVDGVTFFYSNYTQFYVGKDFVLSNTIMLWKGND